MQTYHTGERTPALQPVLKHIIQLRTFILLVNNVLMAVRHGTFTVHLLLSPQLLNLCIVSTQPLPIIKWKPIKANRVVDLCCVIGDLCNR